MVLANTLATIRKSLESKVGREGIWGQFQSQKKIRGLHVAAWLDAYLLSFPAFSGEYSCQNADPRVC
jgi:hypothetical protein